MAKGAIKRIAILHRFKITPDVPCISKLTISDLITYATNNVMNKPLIGNIMLAVKKSRKSKKKGTY